jgi:hypothetical protein
VIEEFASLALFIMQYISATEHRVLSALSLLCKDLRTAVYCCQKSGTFRPVTLLTIALYRNLDVFNSSERQNLALNERLVSPSLLRIH